MRFAYLFETMALSVSVAMTGCALSGRDDGVGSPEADASVTVGPTTGDLFAYGTVLRNGKPAKDVQVFISLEDQKALEEAEVGDKIESFEAASDSTDDDGNFELGLDAETLPTMWFYDRERDFLNFNLQVFSKTEFVRWASTVYAVDTPAVWRTDGEAASADSALRFVVDLGKKTLAMTDSFGETEKHKDVLVVPNSGAPRDD